MLKALDYHVVVVGWRAFRLAACAVWPCESVQFETLHHAVLATISVITTLFFLLCSPLVVMRGSRALLKSAARTHWSFIFGGYFLWWWSFLLLAIGLFVFSNERRKEARFVEVGSNQADL